MTPPPLHHNTAPSKNTPTFKAESNGGYGASYVSAGGSGYGSGGSGSGSVGGGGGGGVGSGGGVVGGNSPSRPPLAPAEWTRPRSSSSEERDPLATGVNGRGGDKGGAPARPPRVYPASGGVGVSVGVGGGGGGSIGGGVGGVAGRGLRSRRTASLGEDEERLDRKTERRVLLTSAQLRSKGSNNTDSDLVGAGGGGGGGGGVGVGGVGIGAGGVVGRRARARQSAGYPMGGRRGGRRASDSEDDEYSRSSSGGESSAAGAIAANLGSGVLSPLRSPMRREQEGGQSTGPGVPKMNGLSGAGENRKELMTHTHDQKSSGRLWASLISMGPANADKGAGLEVRAAAATEKAAGRERERELERERGLGGAGGAGKGGGDGDGGGGAGAGGGVKESDIGAGGEQTGDRSSAIASNSPLGAMVMVRVVSCFGVGDMIIAP